MGQSKLQRGIGKPERRIQPRFPEQGVGTTRLEGRSWAVVHRYALLAAGAGILPDARLGAMVTERLLQDLSDRIRQLFDVSAADLRINNCWMHETTRVVARKAVQSLTVRRCELGFKWLLLGSRAAGILRFAPVIGLGIVSLTQVLTVEIVGLQLIGECRRVSRRKDLPVAAGNFVQR